MPAARRPPRAAHRSGAHASSPCMPEVLRWACSRWFATVLVLIEISFVPSRTPLFIGTQNFISTVRESKFRLYRVPNFICTGSKISFVLGSRPGQVLVLIQGSFVPARAKESSEPGKSARAKESSEPGNSARAKESSEPGKSARAKESSEPGKSARAKEPPHRDATVQ